MLPGTNQQPNSAVYRQLTQRGWFQPTPFVLLPFGKVCTTHSLGLIPMGLFEVTPSLHWHQVVGGIGTVW